MMSPLAREALRKSTRPTAYTSEVSWNRMMLAAATAGHLAERLRQDDQTHHLAVSHAQRLCSPHLALGNRLHAGADDFAEVRGFEHHEGHDAGGERTDRRVSPVIQRSTNGTAR